MGSLGVVVVVVVVVVCSVYLVGAVPTAEVMSHVHNGFGKAFDECTAKVGVTAEIMEEWNHFWSDEFELKHREIGCLIQCMSEKHELLDDDARMHHQNMDDFIKSFPQGHVLAKRMVEIIHGCEKEFDSMEDHCDRILQVSKCFKATCKKENIAPTAEMLVSVVIME